MMARRWQDRRFRRRAHARRAGLAAATSMMRRYLRAALITASPHMRATAAFRYCLPYFAR